MEAGKPSRTAVVAAFFRAYHFEHDRPLILADGFARRLITDGEHDAIAAREIENLTAVEPAADRATALRRAVHEMSAAGHVLVRARYTEDRLAERGFSQYVLVGAGLDTFAFRGADARVDVFEVDHPSTQAMKRRRLAAAGLLPPPNLHFVAADLERESVADALARAPFARGRPALFGWLGVTMYLTREAVFSTLAALGRAAAPGSEVIFDYVDIAGFGSGNPLLRLTVERARELGEPFISGFDPAALPEELSATGLGLIEDLGAAEVNHRYFDGRADGLRARPHAHVACAAVQGRTPV
jgi:methyltransferase (TIGR00027 family)